MRILISIPVVVALSLCFINCRPEVSEHDMRSKIFASLPVGSSKQDVIDFLDENSFHLISPARNRLRPDGNQYLWISASFKQNVFWWGEHYTVVDFFFDEKAEILVDYEIHSFYPGPSILW